MKRIWERKGKEVKQKKEMEKIIVKNQIHVKKIIMMR